MDNKKTSKFDIQRKKVSEYAAEINMFRRYNPENEKQRNIVQNSLTGKLFLQMGNMLISVPIPSIAFDM